MSKRAWSPVVAVLLSLAASGQEPPAQEGTEAGAASPQAARQDEAPGQEAAPDAGAERQDGRGRGRGRRGGRGGSFLDGIKPARQVLRAADRERDDHVTAEEWAAFLAELEPGADGSIDHVRLLGRVLAPMLDWDDDDLVTLDDAMKVFDSLDRDTNAALAADELPGASTATNGNLLPRGEGVRRRRATMFLAATPVYAADADGDGTVSEEEWWPFLEQSEVDESGVVSAAALADWSARVRAAMADDTSFNQGTYLAWIEDGLDANADGALTLADLRVHFESLDTDLNGEVTVEEMAFRTNDEPAEPARELPPLMPWQRNLEDALALVQATGKPLLICVNMDGEMASENFATRRYRDPEFVELARGFVPLIVSPDRHDAVDHDDRGRRIVDTKFGRVTSSEHIGIENELYERYFEGRRVAPRHLAVDREGNVLFDIFLVNDLTTVDRALREHGVPGNDPADPETLTEAELFDSPDAGHREFLEAAFLAGDERTRVRMAGLALSDVRATQHPELLRLALADPARRVRAQGLWNVAQHPALARVDFLVEALRNVPADPGAAPALVAALARFAASDAADDARTRARRLGEALAGLGTPSQRVDVERWRTALSWAPTAGDEPAETRDELVARLATLEERLAGALDDVELNLAFAAATMSYAQLQIRDGRNPSFLLEDVLTAARRAAQASVPDGRAHAFLAWASWLLSDVDGAARHAAEAAPLMLPWAGTPLAARVLALLGDTRVRSLYERMQAGEPLPAAWIADARAAYEVLLGHPHGTEDNALSYLRFLHAVDALEAEQTFLRAALERFPVSGALHAYLRSPALRAGGVELLERTYAELEVDDADRSALRWYEGLALLVAAERLVEQRRPEEALATYRESVATFRASVEAHAEFRESSDHYVCLALAGAARVHAEESRWEEAVADLREGVQASPGSLWISDGLGNTPVETARLVHASLVDAGHEEEARGLREFLGENGLEIEAN